jgi:hypothetical protein
VGSCHAGRSGISATHLAHSMGYASLARSMEAAERCVWRSEHQAKTGIGTKERTHFAGRHTDLQHYPNVPATSRARECTVASLFLRQHLAPVRQGLRSQRVPCWGTWPLEVFSHDRPGSPSECQSKGASVFVDRTKRIANFAWFACVLTTGIGRRSQHRGPETSPRLTWHRGASALKVRPDRWPHSLRGTYVRRRGRVRGSGTFLWLKRPLECFGTEGAACSVAPVCQKGASHARTSEV